jgi:hypothetical protein
LLLALVLAATLLPGVARAQAALPAPPDTTAAAPDTAAIAPGTTAAPPDTTGAAPDTAAAAADTAAVAPDTTAVETPPPPPPRATLRVETLPSGLQVEIDGTPVGRSPLRLQVPPGPHRIRALPADPRRFGTPSAETAVTLAAEADSLVRLDVRPPVVLRTEPEPALVTLVGRPAPDSLLGSTPLSILPSVFEAWRVRFTREAFADTTVPGAALASAAHPLRIPLRRISTAPSDDRSSRRVPLYRKRWVQWSLVGIGMVLTGAAAVWHREADESYDEYLASSNVEEIPELYDRTIDYDRRATTAFIVGQAFAITGGLLLLTGQSE